MQIFLTPAYYQSGRARAFAPIGRIATLICLVLATLTACSAIEQPAAYSHADVSQLYASCAAPGLCGQELSCEGKEVTVKGTIDHANVFERRRYPNLPYEKFPLVDTKSGKSVEVWAVSARNDIIFSKLSEYRHQPAAIATVRGRVVGIDLPIAGRCTRAIKLELHSPQDLAIKSAS